MMIGDRIKFLRKKHRMTQNTFALRLGISQTHISKIEHNQDKPSEDLINKIAVTFSINYDWLRSGKGDMNVDEINNQVTLNDCLSMISQLTQNQDQKICNLYAAIIKEVIEYTSEMFEVICDGNAVIEPISLLYQLAKYWNREISSVYYITADDDADDIEDVKMSIKSSINHITTLYCNRIENSINASLDSVLSDDVINVSIK